jgi:hypothetical protein
MTGRVSIDIPVTVSCSPFDPSLTLEYENVGVSVEQASGHGITTGSGGFTTQYPNTAFACDNSTKTFDVDVLANPNATPFHGGAAAFSASADAQAATPCFGGFTGCWTSPFADQPASTTSTLNLH